MFLTLIMLVANLPSTFAQVSDVLTEVVATPQFFVSLLAGVILAIGFQVLLTALSVAAGISAIGNVENKVRKSNNHDHASHSDSSSTPLGVKISSGVGIWTLITASIALFCASLLAVKLSLVGTTIIGITLGLVIWAAFFTVMAYLEIKSVSSLLGSLVHTAISGIKSTTSAVQHLFQGSPYGKIEDIADKTIHKVREEMSDAFDMRAITNKIDEYMERMEHRSPDYEQVKRDFINLLKDIHIEEKTNTGEEGLTTEMFVKLASEQPRFSKKDVKKLANVYEQAREAVRSGDTMEYKAKKVAAQFTSASEEDIDRYIQQIENYLRNTGKDELSPEAIRSDIERITQDPKNARSILSNRVKQMDHSTLVALLEQNKNINHDQAEKVAGYVEQALSFVAKKVGATHAATAQSPEEGPYMSATDHPIMERATNERSEKNTSKLEDRLRKYFDSMNRPELNYDSLKWDLEQIMHDPKTSFSVLKHRLSQFDKETFIALLTNNDKISREDVESIQTRVEETKNNLMAKVERMEKEAERRIESAKQEALHQAENARKTAASAAWWLFATALVSGIAAAAGGWVAVL